MEIKERKKIYTSKYKQTLGKTNTYGIPYFFLPLG